MKWPAPPRAIGRRGTSLLFCALLDFVYAGSLWRPLPRAQQSPQILFLTEIAPLWSWSLLWLVVGLVCVVGAFAWRRTPAVGTAAFLSAIMIKVFWTTLTGLGWVIGAIDRGWVAAAVWLALAVLVVAIAGWPEPAEE